MFDILSNEIYSWMGWLIIPIIVEIIPAIGNFIILLFKSKRKEEPEIEFLPNISLLVPVYNSSATLEGCIKSINDSTYPNELIDIILINNKSKDNSFDNYTKCQGLFPTLTMQWLNASQGKSKALNLALFNANGKYIINIDSDGKLESDALYEIVRKFENNKDIHCMTGIILTEPALIEETKSKKLKFLQKLEFLEYNQAFLVGRNFNSEFNNIFTLSGAFSAFRKSTILKTQMYNTNTICEDAHLTFQVKKMLNQKVALCEKAIFMVDPIESMTKLYTQRQRWQIGELEVLHMFNDKKSLKYRNVLKDSNLRLLLMDHTFAFPRLIWMFALFSLGFYKYSMSTILIALTLIYVAYSFVAFLNYIASLLFLKSYKKIKDYYKTKFLYLLAMPVYNIITFIFRVAGIVNSITRGSSWKALTYKEELENVKEIIKNDFSFKKDKKENKKMSKKGFKIIFLSIFLLINISSAIFFLGRNTQNNYENYAKAQETTLYSIINTSTQDIDILTSAIEMSKMSSGQHFYLYNKTDDKFIVYADKNADVNDSVFKENMMNNTTIFKASDDVEKVLSSMELMIDNKQYILSLSTDAEYIDSNLNNSEYNMFILIEFAILYILVISISLIFLNVDKKYEHELRNLNKNFEEYKNKLTVETNSDGLIITTEEKAIPLKKGMYSESFMTKLRQKLDTNKIVYKNINFKLDESLEDRLIAYTSRNGGYVSKNNSDYSMILIKPEENKINEIKQKIKENGGTDID